MGRISRGEQCSVNGCNTKAEYSVSYEEARVLENNGYKLRVVHGRVYLCRKHYKELKKLKKNESKVLKWRFRA